MKNEMKITILRFFMWFMPKVSVKWESHTSYEKRGETITFYWKKFEYPVFVSDLDIIKYKSFN